MSEGSLGQGINNGLTNQATEINTDRSDNGSEAIIRAVAIKHSISLGHNDKANSV